MDDSNNVSINIRKKTEEFQDVFRDLERWEVDIKITDEQLRNNNNQKEALLPPVRSYSKVINKNQPALEKKHNVSAKTITGTDYNSWDKFDVDKALEEIDSGEGDSNSETESDDMELTLEEENVEIEKKKQKAMMEKERGNTLFTKGKYNEAIAAYSKGLRDDPTNAVLPANRAMALLKTGQIAAAEQDCTLAISLDCTYIKAFHRRGTCRFALKKYQLARQDFLKVLEMDPANKYARTELDKIEEEFRKRDKPIMELQKDITKLNPTDVQKEINMSISPCKDIEVPAKSKLLKYDQPGLILPIDKKSNLRSKVSP